MRYSVERAQAIVKEAAKESAIFTTEDRIGLVSDALALSQALLSDTSSLLNVIELFKDDKESWCLLESTIGVWLMHQVADLGWKAMNDALQKISCIFWEDEAVTKGLRTFQAVSGPPG